MMTEINDELNLAPFQCGNFYLIIKTINRRFDPMAVHRPLGTIEKFPEIIYLKIKLIKWMSNTKAFDSFLSGNFLEWKRFREQKIIGCIKLQFFNDCKKDINLQRRKLNGRNTPDVFFSAMLWKLERRFKQRLL